MLKSPKILTTLLILLFTTNLYAAAPPSTSSCQDITRQYYEYNKTLPASAANNIFPYAWQDMSWLIAQLGAPAKSTNFTQTKAIWKKYNYSIITEDGKIVTVTGNKPPELEKYTGEVTFDDANLELGPPDELQTGAMVQSTWNCENNSNLTITANQTKNQRIISYSGTYCMTSAAAMPTPACENFSNYQVNFPDYSSLGYGWQKADLYIQHPPTQPQYSDADAIILAHAQTLKLANDEYHAQLQNSTQLQTYAIKLMTAYYANLRKCVPGTDSYLQPFLLGGKILAVDEIAPFYFVTKVKITGMVDNFCLVDKTAKIGKHIATMTCKYTPLDLAMFTDAKAAMDALYPSNFDQNQVAQTKALLKNCQLYFDGAPLPAVSSAP